MAGFIRISELVLRKAWRRVRQGVMLFARNPLDTSNQTPTRLVLAPVDLRQSDIFVASEIIAGRFPLAGTVLDTGDENPFTTPHKSDEFKQKLHAFRWLRHLRTSDDLRAADRARDLTGAWIDTYLRKTSDPAWKIETVAQRLIAFLSHSPIILEKADQEFYQKFLYCISQHVKFLRRVTPAAERNVARLHAKIAISMASVCLPSSKSYIRAMGSFLDQEMSKQILSDGGHISRNPLVIMDLLADLLPLRQTYINLDYQLPENLIPTIDRMFSALRFFRHSSGDLALFNGSSYISANYLLSILQNDERTKENSPYLSGSRFARLEAGKSVLLADVGNAPVGELSKNAYAGCLSFEFSSGANRLIVNAGGPTLRRKEYTEYARLSAAHSTLIVNDTSSARVSQSSFVGPVFIQQPQRVKYSDERSENHSGFQASHDGYADEFNIIHERQINLQNDGMMISGLDNIRSENGGSMAKVPVTIRFHVHPANQVSKAENGMIVISTKDGEQWAFTSTLEANIESDIFFSGLLGPVRSQQISLSFNSETDTKAAWIFKAIHTV